MSDQPQSDPQQPSAQEPSSSLATTPSTTGLQPTSQPTSTAAQTPAPLAVAALAAPFVNKLDKVLPYFGTSSQAPTSTATIGTRLIENVTYSGPITIPSTVSAGVATPVPPPGNALSRSILAGYIRIKAFGAGTLTNISVTGSDGTNTEILCNEAVGAGAALTATTVFTKLIPFESEISPTSFIVTLTGATGATVSIEINGSTGIN